MMIQEAGRVIVLWFNSRRRQFGLYYATMPVNPPIAAPPDDTLRMWTVSCGPLYSMDGRCSHLRARLVPEIRTTNFQDVMKALLSLFPVYRVAKALLFIFAASAACAFFSACTGPAYRHERRVDRRVDRQDYREDRRHNRWDRRYERWD